jgi:hypothetical protein
LAPGRKGLMDGMTKCHVKMSLILREIIVKGSPLVNPPL